MTKKAEAETEVKHIQVPFQVKAIDGMITGIASTDKMDWGYDVVESTAFDNYLENKKIPLVMLLQHEIDMPIGIWEKVYKTAEGLKVEGKIDKSLSKAVDALFLIENEMIKGLSIGYKTIKYYYNEEGIRVLEELELVEVSIVVTPMNDEAVITDVKNGRELDVKKLKVALKRLGFTNKECEAISHSSKEFLSKSKVGLDIDKLDSLLEQTE